MMKLSDSAQYLKGVGPRRLEFLSRLGLRTVADVLQFFPRKYIDRGDIVKIADATQGKEQAMQGRIVDCRASGWGRRLSAL
ncbi:MAG: DNA helicase RecG, partial [Phycisphaerae bacterium]|nr:DNA helicase RecG [Phycisphaerae bacterium]